MIRIPKPQWRVFIALVVTGLLIAVWLPAQATNRDSSIAQDNPAAPMDPTAEPVVAQDDPALPTEVPPTDLPEPTAIPTDVESPAPMASVEPIATIELGIDPGDELDPDLMQTFCRMNISDLNDNNPFTYSFTAVDANNIASFAWDFGDTNTANTQTANHTYTTTGTFSVVLTCTPNTGFGPNLVLTGSITINSTPVAAFNLTPGTVFTGLPPFTIGTVNNSTGGGLTYQWAVSTDSNPTNVGAYLFTSTAENITYTFTSAEIITYPAIFWFHLTITDGAGVTSYAGQSVAFNAPAPLATFNLTPNVGPAPLTITVLGVDLLEGPITNWSWDFNGDMVEDANGIGPHNYTYPAVGGYTVRLSYTGPGGGGTAAKSVVVAPNLDPVQALFTWELIGTTVGGVEVCFNNNSTGPVATSQWDFDNDGTFDLTSNDQRVCHIYPDPGAGTVNYIVRLRVENAGGTSTSTASENITIANSPVADFNINPGFTIIWGTLVNFVDVSTGVITTWEWDFNGDGTIDSTAQNPTNISVLTLGANPIRLTVTGPGGTSFVEKILYVERLELVCAFSGTLNVLPGSGPITYTSNVTNQGGRPITYTWTITGTGAGLPMTFSTPNITVNWATIGFGTFQVTLEATTADGSLCTESQTVTHVWNALNCQMTTTLPGTLYADGNTYTFTANVSNINGRALIAYEWYVDGVLQYSGPSNTFNWTNTTNTAILPLNVTISYVIIVDNGPGYNPTTSTCTEARPFTVQPWPLLVCSSLNGPGAPVPVNPTTGAGVTQNYQAIVTGVAGRTVTYTWSVSDGTITTPNPRVNNNNATVQWNTTSGSLPPVPNNDTISVNVVVSNPDGTNVNCNLNRNISVTYNNLVCNLPVGDVNPVVGEAVNYVKNITNIYGRSYTILWEFEQLTPVSNVITSGVEPFNFTFLTEGATYRLRYTIVASPNGAIPGDTCTSGWLGITVYGLGVGFECESVNLVGNATPTNPAGSFTYTIDMDNGNGFQLRYTWILRNRDGTDFTLAGPIDLNTDGIVTSPAFTLAQLGPAPYFADTNYTLRVEVAAVNPLDSTYTCSRNIALNVGTVTATYTYTVGAWTNVALPINQAICPTNTSVMNPGAITDMTYVWQITRLSGGNEANNSWGATNFTTQNIACGSFAEPGSYRLTLTATNPSGSKTNAFSVDFTVYGLQSILITRSGSNFGPSTQNFTAPAVNITGGWFWEFFVVGNPTPFTTRNVQNPNNVPFPGPGNYRAVVRGNGPLGTTTASLEFTLLSSGGLTAAFTATQYGGVAPMNVCYTDTSVSGTQIILWEWDLDGNGTYELTYDQFNIPPSICYNYTVGGQVITVRLRVTNAAFTDTASNVIRTYNVVESNATFSVIPQGGAYFCFQPQVNGAITVTGWDFGDGNTGPATGPGGLGQVCHTYGASGTYVVAMNVTDGTTTGTVVRVVIVIIGNSTPPNLAAVGSCAPNVTATFTISNTGGAMTTADQVRIFDQGGNLVLLSPVLLATGGTANFVVSGIIGTLTLITTDLVVTTNTYCAQPPLLSINHVCAPNGAVTFTITNTGIETAASQPYEIRDAANALVQSGTLNVPTGGSTPITVNPPASYGQLTFSSVGIQGATTQVNQSSDCITPPLLNITHACQANGAVVFTITNASTESITNQPYTIRNAASTVIQSGTLAIGLGSGTNITVNPPDSWGQLTFDSNGGALGSTTVINQVSDCNAPPHLVINHVCASNGAVTFTITNNAPAEVSANQAYEIRDAANTLVASGTLNIVVGGSQTVTVNPTASFGALTFTSNGGAQGITTVISRTSDCVAPPHLAVTHICQPNGTAIFTVTNNAPAEMASNQLYEIRNAVNVLIQSGVLNIPVNGSRTLTVLPTASWDALTLTTNGGSLGATTVLNYTSDCNTPPQLSISHVCQPNGAVSFTINNAPTSQTAANQSYEIRNASSVLITTGTLNIAVGGSQTVTVNPTASYNQLTFTSSGGALGITTVISNTSDCAAPPQLTINHLCQANGSLVFTVSNSLPAEVAANQPYEVRDATNALVTSGTLTIPVGGSQSVTLNPPSSYGTLTFTSTGGPLGTTTVINYVSNCSSPAQLSISHACQADGSVIFTIVNATAAQSSASQPYTITNASNTVIATGNLVIPIGGSQTVTVIPPDSYGVLNFSSVGLQGGTTVIDTSSNCDAPAQLAGSAACQADGSVIFTVTNNAPSETVANQAYEVRDASNVLIDSGTLNIAINGSQTITVGGPASYGALTLTSNGTQGPTTVISVASDCNQPPVLSVSSSCALNGTATFTVTNASTESAASQPYEVRDASNAIVDAGTLVVAISGTTNIVITDVYGNLTFSSTGPQGITTNISSSSNCAEPPRLSGSATCELGTAVFTLRNSSTMTPVNQIYTIYRDTTQVSTGTLNIPVGDTQTVRVDNMEGVVRLETSGVQGITTQLTLSTSCSNIDALLSGSSVCNTDGSITFSLRNNGPTPITQDYQVLNVSNLVIMTGTLSIAPQATQDILVPPTSGLVTLVTEGNKSTVNMSLTCNALGTPPGNDDDDTFTRRLPGIDVIAGQPDTSIVDRPEWEEIGVGGASVCPDWLVYHTNMTGDWEIFRLGNGEGDRLAQFDPNLSQGRGQDITDMSPTRSNDGDWIAFTSNRDSTPDQENWELYISKVDNSEIRRLTYNTFAKDIDPAWSPDGRYIAFETDRDGNWELYLFDLLTGAETRLTDDVAHDINPFWSPDAKQIAFQSDRSGKWQIYLLDVATGEVTLVSDGTTEDHDPHISFDGEQIAFRAYANGGNSGIYLMNIDGSDKALISDLSAGSANHTWSPDDSLIAYQSNLDGDLDIYVYEIETGETRLVTDNEIPDYAPTWWCDAPVVVFTSDVTGDPNIFSTPALPIDAQAILVDVEANQLTTDPRSDVYPENTPSEENASREGNVPPIIGGQFTQLR
jgi:Tol biopolymer transport system component/PKD repeat protein